MEDLKLVETHRTEQKILLIEDNPGDRRLIQEMLNEITTFKYKLVTAENLKTGCELINQNAFILILLDLNLPDSSGKNTFDRIFHQTKKTPVVLVSGMQNVELSLSLIKGGAQDFITKTDLNSDLLARTIEFAIERKKLMCLLEAKTNELERLNSYFVNREIRMTELKKEINILLEDAGKAKRYS